MIPARGKRLKRKKRDKIDYTTRKNVVYEYFVIEKNITWHVFSCWTGTFFSLLILCLAENIHMNVQEDLMNA